MSTNNRPTIFDSVVLDTPNVKIRPLSFVSWEKLASGILYENSFHALNWGLRTPEDIQKMYGNALAALEKKSGNPIVFLSADESEVVGMTNFMNVEPANNMIEIGGTWIAKKWQRSHVNTETKFALLQYCIETLKLCRVEFRIDTENLPSQRAVQRLGFQFDGYMPRRKPNITGENRDYVFYSVTDKNWPDIKTHILSLIEKSKSKNFEAIKEIRALIKSDPVVAFEKVQSAIQADPKCPELQYLAAYICDGYRTEAEAVPFYLKALELGFKGVDRRDAILGLASTYRSLGQYENSKKTFEMGLKEFPNYRPYAVFLALTEFNLKNNEKAMQLLLTQIVETSRDQEILSYKRALEFYSTRLSEVFQ